MTPIESQDYMTIVNPLLTEVLVLEGELNEAQRMIDHARKTVLGRIPIYRSMLDRRQLTLDSQRLRVNAAITYLSNRDNQ